MATVASLMVTIGADIASLEKNVAKVTSAVDGIDKKMDGMKGPSKMEAAFTAVGVAAGTFIGNMATRAVDKLTAEVGRFVTQGMNLHIVERSFVSLSTSAKVNSEAMLDAMRDGTQGMVTNYDLMLAANKAMLLGLPVTTKSMGTLAQTATTLGRAMGQDATKSLNDLITALGRSSPMILDNLGITVKVGEANKEYAQRLNIVGRELTDGEKKLAFYEAAMSRAAEKVREIGDLSMSGADHMASLTTQMGNLIAKATSWVNIKLGGDFAVVIQGAKNLATILGLLNGTSAETADAAKEVATQVSGMTEGMSMQGKAVDALVPKTISASEALKLFDEANRDNEEQLKKTFAAQDRYNAEIAAMADQFKGGRVAAEVTKLSDAVRVAGGAAKITAYEKEQLGKKLSDLTAQGAKLTPTLHAIWLEYERMHPSLKLVTAGQSGYLDVLSAVPGHALKAVQGLKPLPGALAQALQVDPLKALDWMKGLPGLVYPLAAPPAKSFAIKFQEVLITDLPKAILAAIQGGGSVIEAAGSLVGSWLVSDEGIGKSLSKGIKDLFGAKLGGFISSALPGLGALVGPAITGLFGKLFGSAGRDAVKAFANSMGGFDALREKLLPLGDVGEKLWVNLTQGVGKNNPEQAKAAIQAITQALQEQEQFIAGLVPSWADTLALAEKYGLEVSQLGEKFEQARLADMANTIAVDFRKLIAAGVDMNTVLTGMQDEVQGVVSNALALGIEIPDSLQPVIAKMVELGMLTDSSGNKLTDLTKLNFSESLSKSVDRIIDALDRLIEKLDEGVGGAIRKIPSEVNVKVKWDVGSLTVGGEGGEPGRFHAGGWVKAHRGMNKVLPFKLGAGEVPIIAQTGEAVLNRQAAARLGEAGVAALNAGGSTVVDMGAVVAELRGQRADARRMAAMAPGMTARAMRDAMMLAG